jgi:hypothetical protein
MKEFGQAKAATDLAAHGVSKAERGTLIELLRKRGMTAERELTDPDCVGTAFAVGASPEVQSD